MRYSSLVQERPRYSSSPLSASRSVWTENSSSSPAGRSLAMAREHTTLILPELNPVGLVVSSQMNRQCDRLITDRSRRGRPTLKCQEALGQRWVKVQGVGLAR